MAFTPYSLKRFFESCRKDKTETNPADQLPATTQIGAINSWIFNKRYSLFSKGL